MATGIGSVSVTVDNVRLNDYFHAEDKSKIGPNKVRTPLTVRVLRVSRVPCLDLCMSCAALCVNADTRVRLRTDGRVSARDVRSWYARVMCAHNVRS